MEVNIRYCKECSNTMAIQGIMFECINCKAHTPIENGTVIYVKRKEISNISTVDVTLNNNGFLKQNPLYACMYRTCDNKDCPSHLNKKKVSKHRKIINSSNDVHYFCLECR